MPERNSHAPGSFCFPEVSVADAAASKRFYGEVLGWEMTDVPGSGYTLARRKGKAVAGLHALFPGQRKAGVPPHWLSYVRVASSDAAAAKAAELGGTVLAPAFDVPGIGRMAVLQDPTGAVFATWEAKGMEGVGLADEPGAPCWYELMTTDTAKAKAFYTGLFGWTAKASTIPLSTGGEYTEFLNGKEFAGGMMPPPKELVGKVPPHWLPYVAVEDCDATAKECSRLGGRVNHPPSDIPKVGRFAVLSAPDGATFGVIRLGPG